MKVFIAGATGVLGRRLIRMFRAQGATVVGVARNSKNEATIRGLGGESRKCNLFDAESLARAAGGADVVIHAATAIPVGSQPGPKDWETNDRIRREGTKALAEATGMVGARTFIAQSVVWVARPADQSRFDESSPVNPDAITQSTADLEAIAREEGDKHGFQPAILRFGWFHSADSGHTRLFAEQLAARRLPIIGRGDALWSWIHVDDAASAVVAAAHAVKSGIWHVVDNQPIQAGSYLRAFAERIHAQPPRRVPPWLARLVAGSYAVNLMSASTRTSNAKFRRDFNWSPKFPTYSEALEEIVAQWRAEGFLIQKRKVAA